jgi:AmiR/NasT family two-component response regulator
MPSDLSATVRRAVEIVAEQLDCDENTALEALRAVAGAAEESLEAVALHVLDGTVRFDA